MSPLEMNHTLISSHSHQTKPLLEKLRAKNCEFCVLPRPSAYHCLDCKVDICEDCFKIPQEICHWLHPNHHPLRLEITPRLPDRSDLEFLICEGCHYVFASPARYKCGRCEFRMCVECGISNAGKRPLGWEDKELLSHHSHLHPLVRCRFREKEMVGEVLRYDCKTCELSMWGIGYACLSCKIFIHESCIVNTPRVMHHPLHPNHRLALRGPVEANVDSYFEEQHQRILRCAVCLNRFREDVTCYKCRACGFALHFQCAVYSVLRAVKFESHIHSLVCVLTRGSRSTCYICFRLVPSSCFRCLQCNGFFHVECVSVPRKFKHRHHEHILTLLDPSPNPKDEDQSSDCYCDLCEAIRFPTSHVYHCKPCKFYGHIECVLSKEDEFSKFSSTLWLKNSNQETEEAKHSAYSSNKEIKDVIHEHPLRLQNGTNRRCALCFLQINGQAYACDRCVRHDNYGFWVHEKCGTLREILHSPLHNHKLYFVKEFFERLAFRDWFICNACGCISGLFHYLCRSCGFIIDIKCAFSTGGEQSYRRETLKHPVDGEHELILANMDSRFGSSWPCKICDRSASGPLYCCTQCVAYKFYHKTCLEWPSLVEGHPLVPPHALQLVGSSSLERRTDSPCFACGNSVKMLGYKVIDSTREIFFHLECGTSFARLLRCARSNHHLYYSHNRFSKGTRGGLAGNKCVSCQGQVKDSYYRCVNCNLYFHLPCLRLPRAAKHKWHTHRLAFKNYADYGGFYCDICEEPRDSQHPIYGCEDCEFVVHVQCIVSQENASCVTLEEIESDHGESDEGKIPMCSSD